MAIVPLHRLENKFVNLQRMTITTQRQTARFGCVIVLPWTIKMAEGMEDVSVRERRVLVRGNNANVRITI